MESWLAWIQEINLHTLNSSLGGGHVNTENLPKCLRVQHNLFPRVPHISKSAEFIHTLRHEFTRCGHIAGEQLVRDWHHANRAVLQCLPEPLAQMNQAPRQPLIDLFGREALDSVGKLDGSLCHPL